MTVQVEINVPGHVPLVKVTAQDLQPDGSWSDAWTSNVVANGRGEACVFVGCRLVIEEPNPADEAA